MTPPRPPRRPAFRVLYDVFCWVIVVVLGWLVLAGGVRLAGVPWWQPAIAAAALAALADWAGDWLARRNPAGWAAPRWLPGSPCPASWSPWRPVLGPGTRCGR